MEGVNFKKDLFFAVFLALTIHVCLAFARIPVDQAVSYIKTDQKRSLAVSFVSTFREVKKKTSLTPLIKEKKQVVVEEKKATKRKPVKREDIPSTAVEANSQKQSETQSSHKTIEKTSPVPSPGGKSMQKEMGASPAVPRYLENSPPVYPPAAKRKGYEGTVLLSVKILTNGTVSELRVKKSSGYSILDRAALKAVEKWKFEIPFTVWVDVPVRFVLE